MKSRFFLLLVLASVLFPLNVLADRAQIVVGGEDGWTISADTIAGDRKTGIMELKGGVVLIRGEDRMEADSLLFHEESRAAEASGHVVFTTSEFELKCQRFVFNLDNNLGMIYAGTIFFPSNHYYISGDEIEKTGSDDFILTRGVITTCDGPSPAWKLTARNIKVRREGYASATHTALSTRYFPFFYTPFIMVPVKTKRQSGVLMPEIKTSDRDGFTMTLPYFWALSDSKDMTFYLTSMSSRGLDLGAELRYREWGGKGDYKLDFLEDKNPPITSAPGQEEQKNTERFWVRGMSDFTSESGFEVKVDVDLASDGKVLPEFERSTNWYIQNNKQFLDEFGRGLAEPRDPDRGVIFQVSKFIAPYNFDATLEINDNLDVDENIETLHRLPTLNLDLPWIGLDGTALYFNMDSNYTYFTRHEGSRGHRWDVHPRLYWPVSTWGWLDIAPSVGFRETVYYLGGMEEDIDGPHSRARSMFDADLEISTRLSRIFDLDLGRVEKIKHRLRPELRYVYTSEEFKDDLPYFDYVDRVEREEFIEYGLGNSLTAKVRQKPKDAAGDDGPGEEENAPSYAYYEFFRFNISRRYNLLADWEGYYGSEERENGPWVIDYFFSISPYFEIDGTSEYDTYQDKYTKHIIDLLGKDWRGDEMELIYNYDRENEIHQVQSRLFLSFDQKTGFELQHRYSLEEDKNIETSYALTYKAQCWTMRLEYLDRPSERSLAILFTLTGLGELGSHTQLSDTR